MQKQAHTNRLIAEILKQLVAAVRAGNRALARRLAGLILRRYSKDNADLRRKVLDLIETLEHKRQDSSRGPNPFDLGPPPLPPSTSIGIIGGDKTPKNKGTVHPVWFATDRQRNSRGDGFTGLRDPENKITRGRVDVFVPEAHQFGETGTSLWEKIKRRDFRDDRLRIQRLEFLTGRDFLDEIRKAMQIVTRERQEPHALIYLHGYNVNFTDAAIRAAQLDCDLNVPGATAFFSWPSRGQPLRYPADEASIEESEQAITDFMADFATTCGAKKVHIIAHSMGNRGLLRAMQRISANVQLRNRVKFGQVFLAAPDVSRNLFIQLAQIYPQFADRTTLYASDADKAEWFSKKLHGAPRAGYFKPYTVVPGIDTVAVPKFNIDLLGHSYYAQAAALLHDIYDLMRLNEAPNRRQRIRPAHFEGADFWELIK